MHAHRDMFRIEMLLVIWSGYRNYTDTIHSALLVNKRKKKDFNLYTFTNF